MANTGFSLMDSWIANRYGTTPYYQMAARSTQEENGGSTNMKVSDLMGDLEKGDRTMEHLEEKQAEGSFVGASMLENYIARFGGQQAQELDRQIIRQLQGNPGNVYMADRSDPINHYGDTVRFQTFPALLSLGASSDGSITGLK